MIYRDLAQAMGVNFLDNLLPDLGFKIADGIASMRGNKNGVNRQEALLKIFARLGGTSWAELKSKPHGFDLGPPKDMLAEIRLPGKKARLDAPEFMEAIHGLPAQAPATDPDYPFILSTTCRNPGNINTLYQNEKWLEKRLPVNALIMHPDDAYAKNLSEETEVRISSAAGETVAALALSEEVRPGTIYLRGGFGILSRDPNDHSGKLRGGAASMLVPDQETEELTGMPLLSGVPCKVEKIS
jgi:anaerobic selenocysteine-containing dehydrogenase